MRSKKEVDLRRLTKNNSWVGFVVFLVFTIVITLIMITAASAFLSYIIETKMRGEYDSLRSMIKVYDEGDPKNDAEIFGVLDSKKIPYYILDENGDVVHSYGEIEILSEENKVDIGSLVEGVSYYSTVDIGIMKDSDGDNTFVNIPTFVNYLREI